MTTHADYVLEMLAAALTIPVDGGVGPLVRTA